jgi:iron(III) transport system ATP-binding protein
MHNIEQQPQGIHIENLSLSYGADEVLKGVNLEIEPGEFFAFLGPSGSGKSTLLRAIAGFGPTPSGQILVGGEDVAGLPPWKRNVGMVFQSYALWPHMSVARNVAFGLEERKTPKREIQDRVNAALDLVGLRDLADRLPSQLSGGQQQRVALARTIVVEPRVLLLDEPLSNLDANLRVQMRREIRDLQQRLKLTTIFVTHDQEEANTTSDRMAVLDQGVIQQVGAPMALYDRPENLFVAQFLGAANIIKGVIHDAGDGSIFVSEHGLEIPIGQEERGAASIVLRPQNVNIEVAKTLESTDIVRIPGKVQRLEFLGNIIRYAVDIGDTIVFVDDPHRLQSKIFNPGTTTTLGLNMRNIQVLRS